ncbi:putative aromatic compound monooxygenase YhjG [Streptomyces aurantiacus JA 4570]|uniref:Putative aromatic compound monooxygenase YhjG n=2 Tax=Streptomyces aurantiacus TaxID=47760 RepID=S3ZGV5_9ACTN|nr:putative aromatic compound monooxygenase YhjG [Streptomyces aurantiacus JA 4570]
MHMDQNRHVLIAGAGPVGLWLAAELRLGGARVTVLEPRTAPSPHSKALTVHPRTLEVLDSRGVVEPFLAEGLRLPTGHFASLDDRLDFAVLDTPYPFTLALPQARTEALLEEHARGAGADIRRGHRLTGLAEHPSGVRAEVAGPEGAYEVEAAYVVGCDGTRSTVREAAGIGFPGSEATVWGWLGDVVLDTPPDRTQFSVGTPRGGLMCVPLPGGVHRFVGHMPEDKQQDWPGELTFEELRAKVVRITGDDFGMRDPRWLSRFGNAARQAETYRKGRVLLAGDAAHMHFPAGGVGLNVGVQDAANLGWKLAAVVRGDAPGELLDSYHRERHPVGAELIASTRAQTALMTAYSGDGLALRQVLSGAIAAVPEFSRRLAESLSGLSVAYAAVDDAHPLTGRRAPNLQLADGTALFALLRAGRHVLLDLTGTGHAEGPSPDVVVHEGPLAEPHPDWAGVGSALIRPDGHVARVWDAV